MHGLLLTAGLCAILATATSSGGNPTFCASKADGLYPAPGSPNCFYHCSNQITAYKACPAALVFNVDCQCCSTTTGASSGGDPTFCASQADGLYPVTAAPTLFYHCSNQITAIKTCPAALVFNVHCQCCATTTGPTPPQPSTTISSSGGDPNFCVSKADGLHPVPDEPNFFYHCSNQITAFKACPAALVFNVGCQCCNFTS